MVSNRIKNIVSPSTQMTHIPSKEAMIAAVRKSGCANLRCLPLEVMTAEAIYSHLVAAKCPCLARLMKTESKADLKPLM